MSFRNRMSLRQQWRLLELIEANTDILSGDNESQPVVDDEMQAARSHFWDMVTNVLNKMGESYGKYKNKVGWRKAWRDMKSHLRGKLIVQHLRLEDAQSNPSEFERLLAAASLSDLERKIFEICGLSIYEVSPKIRYPSTSKEIVSRKRQMQLVQAKLAKLQRKQQQVAYERRLKSKSMSEGSCSQLDESMIEKLSINSTVVCDVENQEPSLMFNETEMLMDGDAPESQPILTTTTTNGTTNEENKTLDTSATRRSKRENAGKRGGVRSKFVEHRVFLNKRSSSLSGRKVDTAVPPKDKPDEKDSEECVDKSTSIADGKNDDSLLDTTNCAAEDSSSSVTEFHGFYNGEAKMVIDNYEKASTDTIDQKTDENLLIEPIKPDPIKNIKITKKSSNNKRKLEQKTGKPKITSAAKRSRPSKRIVQPNGTNEKQRINVPEPLLVRNETSTAPKPHETVHKNCITQFDVRSIDIFCRGIAVQLKEMPDDKVGSLVTEIQNLIWNRKMLNELNENNLNVMIPVTCEANRMIENDDNNDDEKLDDILEWPETPIKMEVLDTSVLNNGSSLQMDMLSNCRTESRPTGRHSMNQTDLQTAQEQSVINKTIEKVNDESFNFNPMADSSISPSIREKPKKEMERASSTPIIALADQKLKKVRLNSY